MKEWLPRDMVPCFAEHGWQTLELGEEHAHDLLKEGSPSRVGAAFRRYAADFNVSFPQAHFIMNTRGYRPEDLPGKREFDLAPADDAEFDAVMDVMKRWLDLFNALGVRCGVLHAGGAGLSAGVGWDAARIFERRVKALERIAEYAKGGETLICLENYSSRSDVGVETAADMIGIIRAVNSEQVKICLDTGHANVAGVDPAAFIREAGPLLKALHIADNLGQHDNHMLPYGAGTVPWPDVLKALRAIGYDGLFNFEVPGESQNCPLPERLVKLDYAKTLARCMIDEIYAAACRVNPENGVPLKTKD
ncbi:MAG: sugar phosphate isomerase/epimerase [Verrucomicrobia bacterium]|nr:sugar phosphate isomerase/epimerase [Verrucomicrobiota bacterium]MBU4366894.1 sugar phosphate isomerase/epimerase [Verrucomicrobiota bacterium]